MIASANDLGILCGVYGVSFLSSTMSATWFSLVLEVLRILVNI